MGYKQEPSFGSSHIDSPRETGREITVSEKEALADRHYDIDDVGDCFSSEDIHKMDILARCGNYEEVGKMWAYISHLFREKRLESAISLLRDDDEED